MRPGMRRRHRERPDLPIPSLIRSRSDLDEPAASQGGHAGVRARHRDGRAVRSAGPGDGPHRRAEDEDERHRCPQVVPGGPPARRGARAAPAAHDLRPLVARGRGIGRQRRSPSPRPPRAGERPGLNRLTRDRVRELVAGTILASIGDTPLIPLRRVGAGLRAELWAKLESFNPGGSVKDRAALWMVLDAEQRFDLEGKTILDATSGNTGVALALVCAVRGHRVELCLPDKLSVERKRIAAAFGATLRLTDPLEGTDGAILEARRLARDP